MLGENFLMKIRNLLSLVLPVLALLSLSSCALFRYKCNREYAAKKGMDDAANARTAMPGH